MDNHPAGLIDLADSRCEHCARPVPVDAQGLCPRCAADPATAALYRRPERIDRPRPTQEDGASRRAPCRHCGASRVLHRRGLCYACYFTPAIRKKYGPVSPMGNKALGFDTARQLLPPEPTDAIPGSEAKIRVLEARFAARLQMHHPDDAKLSQGDDGAVRALAGALAATEADPDDDAAAAGRPKVWHHVARTGLGRTGEQPARVFGAGGSLARSGGAA